MDKHEQASAIPSYQEIIDIFCFKKYSDVEYSMTRNVCLTADEVSTIHHRL